MQLKMELTATPIEVYRKLLQVGEWWESSHTFSGNAKNMSIEEKAGGYFCEKLANGGVQHLQVVRFDPGRVLVMKGGLGPLLSMASTGAMSFQMTATESGTNLNLSYAVMVYTPAGAEKLAPLVDMVLGVQMKRLKSFVETGKPTAP